MGTTSPSAATIPTSSRSLRFADFVVDLDRATLFKGAEERRLRPKSFEVLRYLAEHPRRLLTKQELMSAIWPDSFVTDNALVQCFLDVRRALDDDSQQLIRTVSKRGYIFEADVIAGAQADVRPDTRVEPSRSVDDGAPAAKRAGISRKPVVWLAALTAVALALAAGSYRIVVGWFPPRVESLAVLPFQSVGSRSGDEYLEIGIADAVITRLSGLENLTVRAIGSVRQFAGGADPIEAGQKLRVGAVVSGTVQRLDGRVRVNVRLLRVADGKAIVGDTFDERLDDTFALEDAISARIARALSITLTGDAENRWRKHDTSDSRANELYMRGRYFWDQRSPEGLRRSLAYFEQATQIDPRYARAYAAIANSYGPMLQLHYVRTLDGLPKMVAAAVKAVELDPDLPDAHVAMAATRFNEWNIPEAERESKRAIELNPSDPLAHMWYGYYLGAAGRLEEAIVERQRSRELDPLNLTASTGIAAVLAQMGRQDEALEQLKRTIELNPRFGVAHGTRADIYTSRHQYSMALEEYRLAGDDLAIARVQALAGDVSAARATLARYIDARTLGDPVQGIDIAAVYSALNDRDEAVRWLERSYADHDPKLIFLKVDDRLASLQSDPRFADLCERIHP